MTANLVTFGYATRVPLSILYVIYVTQLQDYIQWSNSRHWLSQDVDIYIRQKGSSTLLSDAQTNVNILPVDSDIPLRNLFKVAHDILRWINK